MIADLARPYTRPLHRWERERRAALALLAAVLGALVLLVVLSGVAYGGGSGNAPQTVTVHSGDTLWAIAQAHGAGGDVRAAVDAIVAANHLDGGLIHPGQTLVIPPG